MRRWIIIGPIADLSKHQLKQVLKSAPGGIDRKGRGEPAYPSRFTSPYPPGQPRLVTSSSSAGEFFSILLLSSIAMLESALQKLLVLYVAFWQVVLKAMDDAGFHRQTIRHRRNKRQPVDRDQLPVIYNTGGVFIA